MSKAFIWWNEQAYGETGNPQAPSLPSIEDISRVWPTVAPLLHNHVSFTRDKEKYWQGLLNVLIKVTDNYDISDPRINFEKFVSDIYKYREYLKPTKIKYIMNYIDKFCKDDVMTFFIQDLTFSISNPEVVVDTLQYLHDHNDERWMKALSNYGFPERIFDLYIHFISDFNDNDSVYMFRAKVAELLTCITTMKNLVQQDTMKHNLLTRITNLMNGTKGNVKVMLFRSATTLLDTYIEKFKNQNPEQIFSALIQATVSDSYVSAMAGFYIKSKTPKILTYEMAIRILIRNKCSMELVAELAHTFESKFLSIKYIFNHLITSLVGMRTAATLISEILEGEEDEEGHEEEDNDMVQWIKTLITRTFVFFCISIKQRKYVRRSRAIIEILGSPIFRNIKWLEEHIAGCASAAYMMGAKILRIFFDVSRPHNRSFQNELTVFSSNPNLYLKSFPFKENSYGIVENSKLDKKPISRPIFDPRFNGQVDPKIGRYLIYSQNATHEERQLALFAVEDFIDEQTNKLDEIGKSYHAKMPPLTKVVPQARLQMAGLTKEVRKADLAVVEFQKKTMRAIIDAAKKIGVCITEVDHAMPNIKALAADMASTANESKEYLKLRFRKRKLRGIASEFTKRNAAPNIEDSVHGYMASAYFNYDAANKYCPATPLDDSLLDYCLHRQYRGAFLAAAAVVADGTVNAVMATLWEMTGAMLETIGSTDRNSFSVLRCCLIRLLFDYAYSDRSELRKFAKDNELFLDKAEKAAERPICESGLPEAAVGQIRKRASVRTLFKGKRVNFDRLCYMTNPLDMSVLVASSFDSIDCGLEGRDRTLVEAYAIASSPPENAVAVAAFLRRWAPILPVARLSSAAVRFADAVDSILPRE